MEEERQGVSFGDILHVLRKKFIWVIAVTLIVGIIGTLIIQFVYNKDKKTYTLGFDVVFPGIEENVYPDGTTFRINEVISIDNLTSAKEASKINVDVNEIVNNNDISVTLVKTTSSDEKDEKLTTYHYNLVVPAKYFKNKEQATTFIKTAVESPIAKVNKLVNETNYSSNLRAFENCKTSYADKIAYLEEQRNYIIELYDELIELCGETYAVKSEALGVDSGATLKDFKLEVENTLSQTDTTYLKGVVKEKFYVLKTSFNYAAYVDSQIVVLNKEKTENQAKIDAYIAALGDVLAEYDAKLSTGSVEHQLSAFESQIATLTSRNADIDVKISDLTKEKTQWSKSSDTEQDAFNALLESYRDDLEDVTETCKTVRAVVYNEKSDVTYTNYNVVADGGLNILLGILISLVVGFLLIAIIVCCVELPKYLKEKNAPVLAPVQEAPAEKKEEENK